MSAWSGYTLQKSTDNVSFSRVLDATSAAVMGVCTTTLGDFTGGIVFDEINSLTVVIGDGTLASVSRDTLLSSDDNAAVVGSEIIRFRTATLVSAGVYTLTGLLRGRRGTEWAMAAHGPGERFVLLEASTLRRVLDQHADIGIRRYWKAVTLGKSAALVASRSFTDTGVGLKPFSPVDLRVAIDSDVTLTWKRRTRKTCRFVGTGGISVPLGELAESYSIDVIDTGTLKRTLTASTPTVVYTAAMQSADGTTPTGLQFDVYQISAEVGRGYPGTVLT